ncbi:hypothetical protein [Falsiroseomonas tokyonensis]|uniref:DUF4148 domain-containing protein n=1 Tax=Falsiroseomonas tokyonensis TaxID=430521 RepID=A0ABV7BQ34_9PROT|nr:hypothetical protein [Falsiroseomonas tokyonensis]MBU8536580.1 hypothetical protein [Falsiroseomonas tokyonensis]
MPTSSAQAVLRRLVLALGVGSLLTAPSFAQPGNAEATESWQRQQPTVERTRRLAREEGVAASPQERREQLRDLNAIARELLPPDPVLPAPGLRSPGSGGRPAIDTPVR